MDVDLQACVAGDKLAWDAFTDRYAAVIFAAVQRTISRHRSNVERSDLEDTVQEVFVRLVKDEYRLLRTYDPGRASITTWLTLVARSVTIDRLRARPPEAVPLQDSTEVTAVATGLREPIRGAPEVPLQILTSRQRLVLRMLFDQEMSVEQVALLLNVDAQTVRSTKHKALTRLREHLSPG